MKVEIYIPEYEKEVIDKVLQLKAKRKLSQEVVNLLKGGSSITREEVIELIKKYSTDTQNKNATNESELIDSISSVLNNIPR